MTIHEKIKTSEAIVYSDDELLLVLDHDPITVGHALILPQKAYLDIDEIPLKTLNQLFKAAQVYLQVLQSIFSPKGYSIMQNGGAFNDIGVFHLHVFPRFDQEEFGYQHKETREKIDIPAIQKRMEKCLVKIQP